MTERQSGHRLRCAIYTRKSTEEGLEQQFNSLHAQRETCEAFIASQRHQGWIPIPSRYDDGGFSGGSMDRPGLQQLLDDIEAGRVDVIVVYKVDRLTRALSDFARLVDLFDRKQVSFVSITQQFNTTTSMGRLTLNVLLSFAQFEREVIGERIRDKIAAPKRKGLWMGGQPPLGYDVREQRLTVNDSEAAAVVTIFRRYLELQSVHTLRDELATAGLLSKQRRRADGALYGGRPLGRGALYAMLQNRIYRGMIVDKGNAYLGEHAAIIDQALWDEVQSLLARHRDEQASGVRAKQPSLLSGMLSDISGEKLTPTHSTKKGTRYHYYVSASLIRGAAGAVDGWRIPAADLNTIVVHTICGMLGDPALLIQLLPSDDQRDPRQRLFITAAAKHAEQLRAEAPSAARAHLLALGCRVVIGSGQVEVLLSWAKLIRLVKGVASDQDSEQQADLRRSVPFSLRRAGRELRLTSDAVPEPIVPNRSLLRLVARAYELHGQLVADPALTVSQLSARESLSVTHIYKLLRLRWLAPDIVEAFLEGRQPAGLNATKLLLHKSSLPLAWADQRKHLGLS